MAANFQPAQPFSSAAYAAAGAGPIIDRQIEFQLQQQVAAQNRNQQAAIAALQAQTALNENSNNNDAAKIRQQFDLNAAQRAQAAQFDQQRQMKYLDMQEQDRNNVSRMILSGQEVSQKEMQQMAQQQAGLVEIQKQVDEGILTPEEGKRYGLLLKTKIDTTKQRLEEQTAATQAAHEKLYLQQAARDQAVLSLNARASAQTKEERTVTHLDPQMELIASRELAPKYQAMAAVMGQDAAQIAYNQAVKDLVTERGGAFREVLEGYDSRGNPHFKTLDRPLTAKQKEQAPPNHEMSYLESKGQLDPTKLEKFAKVFTTDAMEMPRPKEEGPEQKKWDKQFSSQLEGLRTLYHTSKNNAIGNQSGQSQPAQSPMQAQQQAEQPPAQQATPEQQKKLEQTVQAISQMPIPDQKKSELLKVNSQINELMQIPKDKMTFEQRQQFFMLYDRLKTLSGG